MLAGREKPSLSDISIIQIDDNRFQGVEELSLLQKQKIKKQQKESIELVEKSRREQLGKAKAEQTVSPVFKGSFVKDLERYCKQISYESEVFDIYDPKNDSQLGQSKKTESTRCKSGDQSQCKALNLIKSTYILDFRRKKLPKSPRPSKPKSSIKSQTSIERAISKKKISFGCVQEICQSPRSMLSNKGCSGRLLEHCKTSIKALKVPSNVFMKSNKKKKETQTKR